MAVEYFEEPGEIKFHSSRLADRVELPRETGMPVEALLAGQAGQASGLGQVAVVAWDQR